MGDLDNVYVECMKKMKICSFWFLKYDIIVVCSIFIEINILLENVFFFFKFWFIFFKYLWNRCILINIYVYSV